MKKEKAFKRKGQVAKFERENAREMLVFEELEACRAGAMETLARIDVLRKRFRNV